MEALVFVVRCIIVLLFSWACVRIIGKKSISQLSSYDFTALMILANVAAEPLVYKISSKAFLGSLTIALGAVFVGWLSLHKTFYNLDAKPDIIIQNGKIDKAALKRNRINLSFLFSLLRLQGYYKLSDVAYAILEPSGNLSVIPTAQNRPVTPKDFNLSTEYEGLSLPLIIDGELQYNNLRYAKIDKSWLHEQLTAIGAQSFDEVFLAELEPSGKLNVDLFRDNPINKPSIF